MLLRNITMESLMRLRGGGGGGEEVNMSEITVDHQGRPSSSSELEDRYRASSTSWTNEKHSLYLRSMEASFINYLHSSIPQYQYKEFQSSFKPFLGLVRASKQSVLCRKNAVGSNIEMMDQNFDGNDRVIESNLGRAKRRKTETAEDNDQVVPVSILNEMRM